MKMKTAGVPALRMLNGRSLTAFSLKARRSRYWIAILLLLIVASVAARAELDLRTDTAREHTVQRLRAGSTARREAALALAHERAWPVRGVTAGGRVFELMELEDGRPMYHITMNHEAAISSAANLVRNTAPFNLNGQGVIAGIWDENAIRTTHQEFGARVAIMDETTTLSHHATHVAGTIGAYGVIAQAAGMAPEVTLHSYNWIDDYAEVASRAATGPDQEDNLYISNHSYGFARGWFYGNISGWTGFHWWGRPLSVREDSSFGQYNSHARAWDELCFYAPYFLPFWAAGNDRGDLSPPSNYPFRYQQQQGEYWAWASANYNPDEHPFSDGWKQGGYNTVSDHGVAKNTMAVGAVHDAVSQGERNVAQAYMSDFSCWGPTDDGRIKPDIVANGVWLYSSIASNDSAYGRTSGTSMSSPNAVGSAVLLIHAYRERFNNRNMRAATLKGLIVHTADDLGNPGPDYRFGWGLMNTLAAAGHIRLHSLQPNAHYMVENALTDAAPTSSYTFAWNGSDPIRVTLSWTDPPGPAQTGLNVTTPVLVNDLDLRVRAPNGTTVYYPYVLDRTQPSLAAGTGDNVLDNIEQVMIAAPGEVGVYSVEISHKGSLAEGTQAYSLLVSGQAVYGTFIAIR